MNVHNQPLLILGTRTLAEEIASWIEEINGYTLAGFVENLNKALKGTKLVRHPVFWINEIDQFKDSHSAVCGLATTFRYRFTNQVAARGIKFATLRHPTAYISSASTVGQGTLISPGTLIASNTRIGEHVFINRGTMIGHHTCIDDFVTIHPGANIAGCCHISRASYVGMGATIIDRIKIGRNSVVGAGAVVTKDVPDNCLVVGVPAKIVKENIEGK